MKKTLIKAKKELVISDYVKKAEAKLPETAKYQLVCSGSPVFTVKTDKEIELIQDSIQELQGILSSTAMANEITSTINPIFNMLASQNGQHVDLQVEMGEWVKLLEGEPLWAIKNAVETVCRTQKFRHFCDLNSAIKKQTNPIVRKVEKLKHIVKESSQKQEEERITNETAISVKQMQKNLAKAAKNGNGFAQNYLKNLKIPKH